MYASGIVVFSFVLSFSLYPASCSLSSTFFTISSSVASKQLIFWSRNIVNHMPQQIVPKLSPLSTVQSAHFASLVSNNSISSNPDFCAQANLACNANLSRVRILNEGYACVDGYISDHIEQVDEHSIFRLSKLEEGNIVYVPFVQDNYPSRSFLPNEIASMISMNLVELKKLFPQSFVSETTIEAIKNTISYCNAPVLKDEIKSCSTSLEGLINFATSALGQKQLLALTSNSLQGSTTKLTIKKITRFNSEKIVSCHDVFLPFSTYFCHVLSSTRLYAVDVVDSEKRLPVNTALAVCHMDTSTWPKNHVAFKILKSSPGNGEACHWMTRIDLVFIGGSD